MGIVFHDKFSLSFSVTGRPCRRPASFPRRVVSEALELRASTWQAGCARICSVYCFGIQRKWQNSNEFISMNYRPFIVHLTVVGTRNLQLIQPVEYITHPTVWLCNGQQAVWISNSRITDTLNFKCNRQRLVWIRNVKDNGQFSMT